MRILHIQFAGPYTEGFNYQENILPKYQVLQNHEVFFLTTCYEWQEGDLVHVKPIMKKLKDGVTLERMDFVRVINPFFTEKLRIVKGVYEKIERIKPDFIMLHDVQSLANYGIRKYLRNNPHVKMIVDCHADFSNSATNWLSKNILHKILWRHMAHVIEPYTIKFYGVLPARVDFLINMYKLPKEKCDLLVMGADDELVQKAKMEKEEKKLRAKYGIQDDDFLIITGGKIDMYKTQTLLLMEAVQKIKSEKVRLIVFGSVDAKLKAQLDVLVDGKKVQYVGWIPANDSYDYFEISDLAVFPGRHSVLWEQVVGQGIPMIVKKWEGTHHVDLGGNVLFLEEDSVDRIYNSICEVINDKNLYSKMNTVAKTRGMQEFSYADIARRSLDTDFELDGFRE